MEVNGLSKEEPVGGTYGERNMALASLVLQVLVANPDLQDSLPPEAHLVIVPVDDPELASFNLKLAKGNRGAVLIYVKRLEESPGQVEVLPWLPGQMIQRYSYA